MKYTVLLLVVLTCQHSIAQDKIYTNEKLGWKMPLPAGWGVMPEDQLNVNFERTETPVGKTGKLLMLGKDRNNVFIAALKEYAGPAANWETEEEDNEKSMYEGYLKIIQMQMKDVKSDSATHYEKIGTILFRVFDMKFYQSNGELVSRQQIIERLLDKAILFVWIQSNNEPDYTTLRDAWKKSTFSK